VKKKTPFRSTARPYRVFFDVLEVKGSYWAQRVATARVVDLGLTDHRAAALNGGADRDRLLLADRWIPLRRPWWIAGSTAAAALAWLFAQSLPWLVALGTAPLMLLILTHVLACRYLGARTPALALAKSESLADGTLAVVSVNDVSGMDLRRIDRALTVLQGRDSTRHDADALAAVKAVLARDRPVPDEEPVPDPADFDPVQSMFDSIVTTMTARTPAQLITELEDKAARR
jgi:hypothetical protein